MTYKSLTFLDSNIKSLCSGYIVYLIDNQLVRIGKFNYNCFRGWSYFRKSTT